MAKHAVLLFLAVWLSGCAAVGLPLAAAGAGVVINAGIEHTMSGIAYKTFTAPLDELLLATNDTLRRMDMTATEDSATPDGRHIAATTTNREIDIELEQVSAATTRMRVTVNKGGLFFKDSATGAEIIVQTTQIIADRQTRARLVPAVPAVPVAANKSASPVRKKL